MIWNFLTIQSIILWNLVSKWKTFDHNIWIIFVKSYIFVRSFLFIKNFKNRSQVNSTQLCVQSEPAMSTNTPLKKILLNTESPLPIWTITQHSKVSTQDNKSKLRFLTQQWINNRKFPPRTMNQHPNLQVMINGYQWKQYHSEK